MRKLRFIFVVFILTLMIPQMATTSSIADEPQPVNASEPIARLPRVYDIDLANEIYEMVVQNRYRGYVQEFTENGERHVYNYKNIPGSNNELSRYWLVDKMNEVSNERLEIEILGDYMSIVGRLPGYLPGEHPAFVISAHYDTMPFCPGANDNGAGIAAVLELLGIMSQYEWPLDIYFVAFNGAEAQYDVIPGRLMGSGEVSIIFDERDIEILAHFDVGAILRKADHAPSDQRVYLAYYDDGGFNPYTQSRYWAELGKAMSNWYGGDFVQTIPASSFIEYYRADIRKFIERGYYNEILAFETGLADDYAYQLPEDVWNQNDYTYSIGREVTALIGASMAYTMSKAYGEATRLSFQGVAYSGYPLRYYVPVTMATILNIAGRWFGSSATFLVYNPSGALIASSIQANTHPWDSTQIFSIPVTQNGLYRIEVWDNSINSLGVELEIDYEVDANLNGISDQYEYWLDTSLFSIDSDSDSISDAMEIIYGTDGTNVDSDADEIPDNWELDNDMDPTDPIDALLDFDDDTLTNLQEFLYGLNPNSADSDMDLLPDAWEIAVGLDPLVNDANEDPDGDNLTNLEEYIRGSDPLSDETEEPLYILWIGVPVAALILVGVVIFLIKRK
ncbi:M28 family peptidase [Candidatus Thorarchaeota archaeon]|nr:MAG: M28 family peptidase [Candidatus Thorarchaeota archaeon]